MRGEQNRKESKCTTSRMREVAVIAVCEVPMRCSGREHSRPLCPGVMSEGGSNQDSWEVTGSRSESKP
jgi:hypothetical protein